MPPVSGNKAYFLPHSSPSEIWTSSHVGQVLHLFFLRKAEQELRDAEATTKSSKMIMFLNFIFLNVLDQNYKLNARS